MIHQDERGLVEVGTVTVKMNDLVNGGEVRVGDHSVIELKLAAERASQPDGSLQGMAKWPPPAPVQPAGQPRPPPPRTY